MKSIPLAQLINHGVSISLVEKVKVGIQELFNLPMEEKKKLWQLPRDLEGFGQAFVVSEEQKLDWGDMIYVVTCPIHLRKPHLFPKIPLPFKSLSLSLSLFTMIGTFFFFLVDSIICNSFINYFQELIFKSKTIYISLTIIGTSFIFS